MNIKEAADYLKVSERTVRRWISEKKLRAYRVGGTYRIDEKDAGAFIKSTI